MNGRRTYVKPITNSGRRRLAATETSRDCATNRVKSLRLLQLHVDHFEYEAMEKEIAGAETTQDLKGQLDDAAVLFVTVESNDGEDQMSQGAEEVMKALKSLGVNSVLVYPYSHLSDDLAPPTRALDLLLHFSSKLQAMGMNVKRAPFGWNKTFTLKLKGHPLAEQAKSFRSDKPIEAVAEAVKSEEKLVSNWFIMGTDGELAPLDSFDLSNYPNLQKLAEYEMAKMRAATEEPVHVDLMKRLGLAGYEPGSDKGNMRFYPKGRLVKSLLERYVTSVVKSYGGMEVETPIMYDFEHPSLASYLNRFPARQYVVKSEEKEYFLRFSACFGQFLMAADAQLSYRQMPLRLYELTRYSFRREKSGELAGLRRLRAFTMPDCHALCVDMNQAKNEFLTRFRLSKDVLAELGLQPGDFEMAIRFTRDFYEQNRSFLKELISKHNRPALVELWDSRFFYFILKWEFNFVDNNGRAAALSTDQIDVENGERYGIYFVDEDGTRKHPLILHNSPSGAIERDIYALLEKAEMKRRAGEVPSLPVWLSPTQARIVTTSESFLKDAEELAKRLTEANIRADVDDRTESVSKKVRNAEREWIPYIIVYGEKEKTGQLSVRIRSRKSTVTLTVEKLIQIISSEIEGKPYEPIPYDLLVSKRAIFA